MTDTRLLALVWPELRLPDADATPFGPMLDALDDLSPRIEAVATGVALLDITGLGALFGSERRIAARAVALARTVSPLRVRAGVGDNRWLAVLAARLAEPSTPDAPAAFRSLGRRELAELPLALLPADPAIRQRFALFGLTQMGQLATLPRSAVGAQFGVVGERLQQLSRGNDARPLVPRRRPERLTAERAFEPPLSDAGAAGLALRALATELVDRLRDRHLAPGRARLELRREDAPPLRIELAFPQPALEPDWIARLLLSRLEAAALSRSTHDSDEPRITRIGLAFDRLGDPQSTQLTAFAPQSGRWAELRWSLERVAARFGDGRLWRAEHVRPCATLPERRSRLVDIGP